MNGRRSAVLLLDPVADEYIAVALEHGSAWVEYCWHKRGRGTLARKPDE